MHTVLLLKSILCTCSSQRETGDTAGTIEQNQVAKGNLVEVSLNYIGDEFTAENSAKQIAFIIATFSPLHLIKPSPSQFVDIVCHVGKTLLTFNQKAVAISLCHPHSYVISEDSMKAAIYGQYDVVASDE